ncbi:hypothetical protein BHM03_00007181 [Ensete ventricosum]|nr:hypothetical protein BHM03_00007181 [Ensete ventricosum]
MGRTSGFGSGSRLLEWWSLGQAEVFQLGSAVDSYKKVGSGRFLTGVDLTCVRLVVRPLTPPYLHPTGYPCRVGHVSGPIVQGREDVAARSTSAISFPPPGKTFSRCPIRVLKMRSCAHLLACGGVGLIPMGADPTEHELGNLNGTGADPTEQELGNLNGAGADPTEQKLGNLNGAGADPTEQELKNLNGAGADPTEQELGNLNLGFCREGELGHEYWGFGREGELRHKSWDLAERLNSGTNPGIWPRG